MTNSGVVPSNNPGLFLSLPAPCAFFLPCRYCCEEPLNRNSGCQTCCIEMEHRCGNRQIPIVFPAFVVLLPCPLSAHVHALPLAIAPVCCVVLTLRFSCCQCDAMDRSIYSSNLLLLLNSRAMAAISLCCLHIVSKVHPLHCCAWIRAP